MARLDYDVVIIGAGIVGASTALWVQPDGRRILLLDGRSPGSATTYGNACTIARYACIPINSPGIFRRLPQLLLSRNSPLRVDWWYALSHLNWQIAFLRNCTRQRVDEISLHLSRLLRLTDGGIDPLVLRSGAQGCFAAPLGFFYVFSTRGGFEAARRDTETRRRYGTAITELNRSEFLELEPGIKMPVHGALLFEGTRFLRNPQKLVECYVEQFTADGGRFLQSQVASVEPGTNEVTVHLEDQSVVTCRKLVVAAGAWSKSIRGSGAEDLPLDAERGYHILFKNYGNVVTNPVAWAEGGFYAVPMEHGLRLAGTVELAGLKQKLNKDRTEYLARSARTMFGDLGEPDDTWLGFRPTLPDSLPVIGSSHRSDEILFAFGHQHIGLTTGGATGKLVADLLSGRPPPIDLTPYRAERFLE